MYLLTYYFAMFQDSRNDTFSMSHVTAMFVYMPFNKQAHVLITNLYLLKAYTVQKLLKEFPSKSSNERSFWRLLKHRHLYS